MAGALNSNIRGKSALRGVYFVPNILGGLVIGVHLQLYFYIYSAGSRKYLQHRFFTKQYSGE